MLRIHPGVPPWLTAKGLNTMTGSVSHVYSDSKKLDFIQQLSAVLVISQVGLICSMSSDRSVPTTERWDAALNCRGLPPLSPSLCHVCCCRVVTIHRCLILNVIDGLQLFTIERFVFKDGNVNDSNDCTVEVEVD